MTTAAAGNGPKEVSIYCSSPQVKIVDLPKQARDENICMILHINTPELQSKLVLKCNGELDDSSSEFGTDW
jgi:hypothetical protein